MTTLKQLKESVAEYQLSESFSLVDKFPHPDGGTIRLLKRNHSGENPEHEIHHERFVLDKKNPRSGGSFTSKTLHVGTKDDMLKKFNELKNRGQQ